MRVNRKSAYDCYKPSDRSAGSNHDIPLTHCKSTFIERERPNEITGQQVLFEVVPFGKVAKPRIQIGDRDGPPKNAIKQWSVPRRLRPKHGFAAVEANVTNSKSVKRRRITEALVRATVNVDVAGVNKADVVELPVNSIVLQVVAKHQRRSAPRTMRTCVVRRISWYHKLFEVVSPPDNLLSTMQ